MTRRLRMCAGLLVICIAAMGADKPQLWLMYGVNLLPAENLVPLEKTWRQAAAAGYDHVLLGDSKFCRLGEMPPEYFAHCQQVKQLADSLHLAIVPAVFPIGYSNDLLSNDPNLAEGVPVRDTPMVVSGGEAHLVADPNLKFEKPSYRDPAATLSDGILTFAPQTAPTRLVYTVPVQPFRCYHVSVSVRTNNYLGQPQIEPIADGQVLSFSNLGAKPTQDWTQHDMVFDSLDHKQVLIYFGVWSKAPGELQWKDWKIEEVSLVNVLRRDGAPCTVTTDAGQPLIEGKDYEPIKDPLMGSVPYGGCYTVWHTPPALRTHLPDGTKLRVSWYYPPIIYDGQVAACFSEKKTMDLLADQARRVKQLWHADGYMMSHDEIRVCNWDVSSEKKHETPGQMLADNLRACTAMLRPDQAYVWSDMFDPYHNAVKGPYYLVNGPWTDSWKGLDKGVIVMNWNFGNRDQSLKWFADHGNRQIIAGYYDSDLSNLKSWIASAHQVKGVVGYMYTTWQSDFSKIDEFARLCRQ
jgi:hypothetical protein